MSADFLFQNSKQRMLRKSIKFSLIPRILLVFFVTDLIWEIIRLYQPTDIWPWKLSLLGVTPAASLSGVFITLIFTREQFAKMMRPSLSWSTEKNQNAYLNDSAWVFLLMNVGPGIAYIENVKYSFASSIKPVFSAINTHSHPEFVLLLEELGLYEGTDFHLRFLAAGLPLPAVKQPKEGIEFAAFKEDFFKSIQELYFHITFSDMVGDVHEKSLPAHATLPKRIQYGN